MKLEPIEWWQDLYELDGAKDKERPYEPNGYELAEHGKRAGAPWTVYMCFPKLLYPKGPPLYRIEIPIWPKHK